MDMMKHHVKSMCLGSNLQLCEVVLLCGVTLGHGFGGCRRAYVLLRLVIMMCLFVEICCTSAY